ncbi:hypothetical protein BD289DRAFT_372725 [Coniella lustricola]|uniref:SPRY domain-containing protein n=1 Tax=Coniella lustricola TaxID=2025994 RepID=A0A2T3A1Z0_9PEZI|nr:hypothetical protein BD289DRAFT_372725 [Coniella lustricola]
MGLFKSNNPFRHHDSSSEAGGSADHSANDYAPPPGPPPRHGEHSSDFAPPPGPPPSYSQAGYDGDYAAPPPGPPPPHQEHNWQAIALPEDDIVDTSAYPPPPAIFGGHDRSWANNATEEQAREGEAWCNRYPLLTPLNASNPLTQRCQPPSQLIAPNANTFSGLVRPSLAASDGSRSGASSGIWTIKTDSRCGDSCITAQPPAYIVRRDDPRLIHARQPDPTSTIYYEVVIRSDLDRAEAGLGLGFVALPYPPFRMPGWHRGSLAVHSDDGHRYVNDLWGGDDFVKPFGAAKGAVVGLGMRFSDVGRGKTAAAVTGNENGIQVECFMTRDGRLEGSWDVNGPRDAKRDLPPIGVQGYHDLAVAVGVFGALEVEVVLDPGRWVYKGV